MRPLPARLFLEKRRTSLHFPVRSRSENALKSGGEALTGIKLGLQFFVLDHPDLQLHPNDFERADVPRGSIQGRSIYRRKFPRGQIEHMRSAAAKLCQQAMRSSRELQPHRDQRTVDLDADVAGKLKDKSSRPRRDVRTAADPCSTIG